MRSLRPYLLVLDGMFLAALSLGETGCGNTDAPIPGPGTGGGCFEAGSPIAYATCTMDAAADACASSCKEPCQVSYPGSSCSENGVDGGTASATCVHVLCGGGRRPHGLRKPHTRGTRLEVWLADAAWMEAASVHAFVRLSRELEAHGAPGWLSREAKRAARDEARHARIMRSLAAARGVPVRTVRFGKRPVRSLETIARENAIEGEILETYAALSAHVQATKAADGSIRSAMADIAPDEKRHAALALAVAEWIDSRLSDDARGRVARARADAQDRLVRDLDRSPGLAAAGIPSGADLARGLFRAGA